MTPQPPPGQGPINPQGVFQPPPQPPSQYPSGGSGGPQGAPPRGSYGPPPPFYMMAPPPPQAPPPSGRSFTRGIFTTLALTIFGISLMLNLYLLVFSGLFSGSGGPLQKTLSEGNRSETVAIVPVNGMIMGNSVEEVRRSLDRIRADDQVRGLVVEVDSPGGSVTASDQIYHLLDQFKADRPDVPVVISQGGLAASGGYYVSCAGDHIVAQPTTMTGNIGVLLPSFNFSKLMDKWGIEETTIHSNGADFKNAGSMFSPERPEERAYLQAIADQAFVQFKDVIVKGRGTKLSQPIDAIANGKIYMAEEAFALGLVDQVGYLEDAVAYVAAKQGLSDPLVVRYEAPPTLADLLGAQSQTGRLGAGGTTINAVNVELDSRVIEELLTPRLMYLWRGQ